MNLQIKGGQVAKIKSYTLLSHQGPLLEVNEDFADIDLKNKVFSVFDGLGGSGIGDTAARKCSEIIKSFFSKVNVDPDCTMPYNYNPHYLLEGNALMNAIKHAHALLLEENSQKNINLRGAVSILVGALSGDILSYASCGNCLGLLVRDGEISTINVADSLFGVHATHILSSFKNYPQSAIGLFPQVNIDIKEIKIKTDDYLCFLTDGIYAKFTYQELRDLISDISKTLGRRAQLLVKKANDRGNLDNQSILIVQF